MWLLPSFNRPGHLARFFAAYDDTDSLSPGMVIIDELDYAANRTAYDALDVPIGWHVRRTKGRTQGDKLREVWDEVSGCTWLGLIGDDCVPETPQWDRRIIAALDGWNFVSCNDGWQAPTRVANCWAISGDLARAVGYIFAPGMAHLFVDDLWETIGRDANCWRVLMDVMVRHAHVMKGDTAADATHKAIYGEGFTAAHQGPDKKAGTWTPDYAAFLEWCKNDADRIAALVKAERGKLPVATDDPEVLQRRFGLARSRKVMIATPVARAPCMEYTLAYARTCGAMDRAGVRVMSQFVIGSSNLPKARNELVARFLATDCTDLVMIDDDMGWEVNDFLRLLASEQPVIAGVGRKRVDKPNSDPEVWCVHFLPDAAQVLHQDDMGAVEVKAVGTGFIRIHRSVFEKLIAAHPEWKRAGHAAMTDAVKAQYYRFFYFADDDGELGEDYAFCGAWRALGGKIFIDPTITLSHVGARAWSGCIGSEMAQRLPAKVERIDKANGDAAAHLLPANDFAPAREAAA